MNSHRPSPASAVSVSISTPAAKQGYEVVIVSQVRRRDRRHERRQVRGSFMKVIASGFLQVERVSGGVAVEGMTDEAAAIRAQRDKTAVLTPADLA